jgi:phosphatidylinositol alpha-1,6-mannosyltransferase
MIGKEKPDVILVGNGRNAFEVRNALKSFRNKVPYVILIHGTELLALKPKNKSILPYLESSCLVANSEYTKSLARGLEISEERVKVLRPGCDPQVFRPGLDVSALRDKLGLSGKKVLLTVGGLVERKGQDVVIRTLAKLRGDGLDVHYVIAGTGVYLDQLKALVREMSVEPYVTFLGQVVDSDLPHLYNLCDLFIMPSREALGTVEGFGMVFTEASACGKPCIAGQSGGMAEAVIDGKTGLIADSSDIDSIAKATTDILTDEHKARLFGMEGRKFVERELSWPVYFESLIRILRSSSHLSSH